MLMRLSVAVLLVMVAFASVVGALLIQSLRVQKPTGSMQILEAKIAGPKGVSLSGQEIEGCRNVDSQITLTLSESGKIEINRRSIEKKDLEFELNRIFEDRQCKLLYVNAHGSRRQEEIAQIVDAGIGAGAKVLMMTDELKRELGYPPQ